MGSEIEPMVRSVHAFFHQQNIIVYPAVLTMVAAMRYGSVAVSMAGKTNLVDHDLDFMLVFPEPKDILGAPQRPSLLQMYDKLLDFGSYLYNTTGLSSEILRWPFASSPEYGKDDAQFMRDWFDSDVFGL